MACAGTPGHSLGAVSFAIASTGGVGDYLREVFDVSLVEDVSQVIFDCAFADYKPGGEISFSTFLTESSHPTAMPHDFLTLCEILYKQPA